MHNEFWRKICFFRCLLENQNGDEGMLLKWYPDVDYLNWLTIGSITFIQYYTAVHLERRWSNILHINSFKIKLPLECILPSPIFTWDLVQCMRKCYTEHQHFLPTRNKTSVRLHLYTNFAKQILYISWFISKNHRIMA
jgi:hypothetical protein